MLLSFIWFIWLWFYKNQSLNMLRHDFFIIIVWESIIKYAYTWFIIILYVVYELNIYDMGSNGDMLLHMVRHDFLLIFIIYVLHVYDMSSNGDILLSSLNFDLENNLIFCLLLSMSWYNLMINCSIYFFYRNLFYYLILLKLENVILFSLVYTWFFIKQCIAQA